MVTVKHDSRTWLVQPILRKDDCPYLYFPNSIHGCSNPIREEEDAECLFEKCPCRVVTPYCDHGEVQEEAQDGQTAD